MLQDLLLLLHAYSLAVGHPDVRLLVIGDLHLVERNAPVHQLAARPSLSYWHLHKLNFSFQQIKKDLRLYLIDVQGLHSIFDKLYVDLCLLWLKLLVRNKLSLWIKSKNKKELDRACR